MQAADLLREAAVQRASDVHLVPGCQPLFRVDGQLIPLPQYPPLTAEQVQQFILQFSPNLSAPVWRRIFCIDFSINLNDTRYRGNALFQRNGLEAVLRLVPTKIPSPEDLLLPSVVTDLANLRSLVLYWSPGPRVQENRRHWRA